MRNQLCTLPASPRSAFTLLEMLVVLMLLALLATLIVPQFSVATDDAKLNALTTNLGAIRKQLEFYRFEHNATYPTNHTTLEAQLTAGTDIAGGVGTTYGPYLMRVPDNPFTNDHLVTATAVNDATPATITAWYYDPTVEVGFRANDLEAHHNSF